MVSFIRGRDSKAALNIGILSDVRKIFFQVMTRSQGQSKHLIANKVAPISEYLLPNGKFDKIKIYNELKQLHGIYKIEMQKAPDSKGIIPSIKVEINFAFDEFIGFDDEYAEKSKRILDLLYD